MALHIFHNRADHTHENEQFRRIAKDLKVQFDEMKWDGLLIGNPNNPDFRRFRADALLYYNNGLLVIDLKDYSGNIKLPPNKTEFMTTKWYTETENDKRRIEIKGGSFINPFKQLLTYRDTLNELIKSNLSLSERIDSSKICAVNIFKGPITLNRETPRDIPYYRIVQESDFQTFLYDFASKSNYYENVAEEWKRIFPAEPWIEHPNFTEPEVVIPPRFAEVNGNIKGIVTDFLNNTEQQVLLLESSDTSTRDEWMQYMLSISADHIIPQTEVWAHSSRIAKRIKTRTAVDPSSLYSTIFGGSGNSEDKEENTAEKDAELVSDEATEVTLDEIPVDETTNIPEQSQEIIGIRSDKQLDENSLIILFEAHLVTRSLHQSELLKFGTGRLLEDMFNHLRLKETKRKLICIGDPYSLAYGKEEESALSKETLSDIYKGEIQQFRETPKEESTGAIEKLRRSIGSSIDNMSYNNLQYHWDNDTIQEVDNPEAKTLFRSWFANPIIAEPEYAVLVYKNADAKTINSWIRKNVHCKQEDFVQGDLLLVNNNFKIPDDLGLSYPQQISNGTYLRVESKLDRQSIVIHLNAKNPIALHFIKLGITCLNSNHNSISEIWILENYYNNANELSLQEQIAFRIFVSQRVGEYIKVHPFENSHEYEVLKSLPDYQVLITKNEELKKKLDAEERVKTKHKETDASINRLIRQAKRAYRKICMFHLLNNDPLVNAAHVQYGYAMNVHKALGSSFKVALFNAFQGENHGISNESYFRWLYTGLSCIQNKVFIVHPLPINPLMNCDFEDTENTLGEVVIPKTKVKLVFPEIEIPVEISNLLDINTPSNVKRGISSLVKILHPKGYLIDKIEPANYLIKSIFTPIGSELKVLDKLCIVMNFNQKAEISSVRVERGGKSDMNIIEDSLAQLIQIGSSQHGHTAIEVMPTDFRNDLYLGWQNRGTKQGYQLLLIEEHGYQDVFFIVKNEEHAKFRVYYTGDGFISKISMIEKSSDQISSDVKNILYYGIEN
jgi:hypothetical protein